MRLGTIEALLRAAGAVVHDLAGAPHLARMDHVAFAHFPPADAGLLGQAINHALHRELGLVGAEPPEGTTHRVVGAHGGAVHVDVGHPVGATGVAGRTLQHLHADARVRTRVADSTHAQRGEAAIGITAGPVLQAHRVAFGVDEKALLTRQGAFHRPPQQPGRERRLPLVAHVFLATERAAVGDELDHHLVGGQPEQCRDLVAVVPDTLAPGVDVQSHRALAVVGGHGQRALRFEEGVLDALRVEHLVHDVSACSQRLVDVATPVFADRQHVVRRAVDRDLKVVDGGHRIDDRAQHPVLHLYQLRSFTGLLLGLGHHDGQHVAGEGGALALPDEHRPILVNDAHVLFAGDVGGSEYRHHAGGGGGRGCIDAVDVGPHVLGEVQCTVQHAGHTDVVDVVAIAEGQLSGFVLGATGTDAAGQRGVDRYALGNGLDRVEHLHVAGAATQVRAEVAGHVVAFQRSALLVDLRLGPHHDAGDAVTALQATARRERIGEPGAFGLVDTLQRGDRTAGHLLDPVRAGDLHLAVDHDRAATALALRRAAVLRRCDVEFLAECSEQMWMIGSHRDRCAVEDELDRHVDTLSKAAPESERRQMFARRNVRSSA